MAPPKRRLSADATSGEGSSHEDTSAITLVAEDRLVKRSRVTEIVPVNPDVVTVKRLDERTSGLAAPTMLLSGHSASVHSLKFDPSGQHVASASFDKSIFLWDVYGECRNYGVLNGHKNAVMEVHWSYDSSQIVSASADKTVGVWDVQTGTRVKKFVGHSGIVNSCCPVTKGPMLVVSGSDDCTSKLWDIRSKRPVKTFENGYQVTAVCFSGDNSQLIAGGLDGDIKFWDLRKDEVSLVLRGHSDIVTSISLSPDGNHLLSNAMDSTVRRWDVRPFVAGSRLKTTYLGAKHSFERNLIRAGWSADMRYVASGSADRYVYIWDAETGALRYHLPGHTGSVNEVAFHPKEPIVGSCGGDKNIYLGELAGL
ncbi:hypothetical protein Poli38472_014452 [Pythium oligandrum]|uniref:Uncharacterized protein n=1 Tax=Pythium oligandrum TaxID=41045 RepID=A0A8K1FFW5_PYTOL|nr:hypothetical protein Poli38472_014452 [Pythium oligandrum]|eukprot:TMW60991.1 hypothetical protein Poli38472_014452 [Pythium oligandrum]